MQSLKFKGYLIRLHNILYTSRGGVLEVIAP